MRYHIWSTAGGDFGIREAETPAAALLALHRKAGYGPKDVWLDAAGDLEFRDEEMWTLCGDLEDWIVKAVEE